MANNYELLANETNKSCPKWLQPEANISFRKCMILTSPNVNNTSETPNVLLENRNANRHNTSSPVTTQSVQAIPINTPELVGPT